jgi:hypothetical protein
MKEEEEEEEEEEAVNSYARGLKYLALAQTAI